jgi:hypothetical protein
MGKTYSTNQVAKKLGVFQSSLQRSIATGMVTAPPIQLVGGLKIRLWTERDIQRAIKELQHGKRKAASR